VRTSAQLRYRGTNWGTAVQGVTPDYFTVSNWTVAEGELFTNAQVTSAAGVCILGKTVARELFGLANPIGESIVMKGIACRVLGVLNEKGATAWGTDQDDQVFVPLTTAQRKLMGITYINHIEVQAASREASYQVINEIKHLLRTRHRLQPDQEDDFIVRNRADLAKTSEESAKVFTYLLGSIASVSLLVGGIGIMNIMLVSVTERTREIGIRMALGARQRDILWQFLLEALVLSSAGGLLGIILGLGSAMMLSHFSSFPIAITPWAVVLAFSFSMLVGMFFGLHPARKASRMKPIEALRYE
jgi:putative ABC transport system permease protein